MKNIILSELDRMIKSRKNRWLIIISIGIFILLAFYIRVFNVGFYDPKITISLNSLNTPPFIIREFHLFLLFIFCPMIFIESFNHEMTSGAYRMYLTRGYKKIDYIISKFISAVIFTGVFMLILYVIGTLFGCFFINKVSETTFFYTGINYTLKGALLYNLKFYLLEYLIVIAMLGICSILSLFSKNSIIAYILSVAVCVGFIYINSAFDFFLTSTKTIFDVLAFRNNTFIPICIIIIVVTVISSISVFKNKDYLN